MRVIGFNFTKISAEKQGDRPAKLEINSNVQILDLKKIENSIIKEGITLALKFSYSVDYGKGFAKLSFEGDILMIVDEKLSKEILKKWKKKKLPDDIRVVLFNLILSKSNVKALQIEEDLNLPPHIPLPRLSKENFQQ